MLTRYGFFTLILFHLTSCRQDTPQINSGQILLSKVEEVGLPNNMGLPTNNTKEVVLNYSTFSYDEKARLIKQEHYSWNGNSPYSLSRSYTLEYGQDGKISKIVDSFGNAVTYTWSGNTLTAIRKQVGGSQVTMIFELNQDDLPIKRTIGNNVSKVEYDINGNVLAEYSNGDKVLPDYTKEFDISKFDPYSSSYELRLLLALFDPESFIGRSRNWVGRTLYKGNPNRTDETIIEADSKGFPKVTKRPYSNNQTNTVTYSYINK